MLSSAPVPGVAQSSKIFFRVPSSRQRQKQLYTVFYLLVLVGTFAASYSEIAAKIAKTPATVFLLPALIPLVPGGSAYYAMLALVQNQFSIMRQYALVTAQWAMGLSAGICVVAVIRQICHHAAKSR